MRVLQLATAPARQQEEDATLKELAGDVKASWGPDAPTFSTPIRWSRDLRTNFEAGNLTRCLTATSTLHRRRHRWRKQQETAEDWIGLFPSETASESGTEVPDSFPLRP